MKICDYLQAEFIFLNLPLPDKASVLHFVADSCVSEGLAKNDNAIYTGLLHREGTMSTGVGSGIAFPHTTSSEVTDAAVFLIRLKDPIDFKSLDGLPVDIVLSLIIPENKTNLHLRLLARVSRLYREPDFIPAVKRADSSQKLWKEIQTLEERIAFP